MGKQSLFRYFDKEEWANAFIAGRLRFSKLSYYQCMEYDGVRSDPNEGVSVYSPNGGLEINNLTQGTNLKLEGYSFEALARDDEIFVCCLSRTFGKKLWDDFKAVTCVEITDVSGFCRKITAALPIQAKFSDVVGGRRIGHRVKYYDNTSSPTPRWALPGLIATSKPRDYEWQDEFRLAFTLTDALEFQRVDLRLKPKNEVNSMILEGDQHMNISVEPLSDICRIRKYDELP